MKTYADGQHKLVCTALGISDDPKAPGPTAYEAVCVLVALLEEKGMSIDSIREEIKKWECIPLIMDDNPSVESPGSEDWSG